MTDAQRIYRSIVDFIDQQTEGLPPATGLKMVRSYCRILADGDGEDTCQPTWAHGMVLEAIERRLSA